MDEYSVVLKQRLVDSANNRVCIVNPRTNLFDRIAFNTFEDLEGGLNKAFADDQSAVENWQWLAEAKEGFYVHQGSELNPQTFADNVCHAHQAQPFSLVGSLAGVNGRVPSFPANNCPNWKSRAHQRFQESYPDYLADLFTPTGCPFSNQLDIRRKKIVRSLWPKTAPYDLRARIRIGDIALRVIRENLQPTVPDPNPYKIKFKTKGFVLVEVTNPTTNLEGTKKRRNESYEKAALIASAREEKKVVLEKEIQFLASSTTPASTPFSLSEQSTKKAFSSSKKMFRIADIDDQQIERRVGGGNGLTGLDKIKMESILGKMKAVAEEWEEFQAKVNGEPNKKTMLRLNMEVPEDDHLPEITLPEDPESNPSSLTETGSDGWARIGITATTLHSSLNNQPTDVSTCFCYYPTAPNTCLTT